MRKKDAHHGGAWKVAYADFVTAMMALFIVLWICKENPKLATLIAGSFRKPIFIQQAGGPESTLGVQEGLEEDLLSAEEILEKLEGIATEMQKLLNTGEPEKNLLDFEWSGDRIKLTLFNSSEKPMFEKDSVELTAWGAFVMESLSWLIEYHKLSVMIDGHAAADPQKDPGAEFGLWEMSIGRANRCRRALVDNALETKYLFRVTGFGDSRPLPNLDTEDPANSRITLTLRLTDLRRSKPASSARAPLPAEKGVDAAQRDLSGN
jgi:chemotaxis protein MotB